MQTMSERVQERREMREAARLLKTEAETAKHRISFGKPVRNVVRKSPAKNPSILDFVSKWPAADKLEFYKRFRHRLTEKGKSKLRKSITG